MGKNEQLKKEQRLAQRLAQKQQAIETLKEMSKGATKVATMNNFKEKMEIIFAEMEEIINSEKEESIFLSKEQKKLFAELQEQKESVLKEMDEKIEGQKEIEQQKEYYAKLAQQFDDLYNIALSSDDFNEKLRIGRSIKAKMLKEEQKLENQQIPEEVWSICQEISGLVNVILENLTEEVLNNKEYQEQMKGKKKEKNTMSQNMKDIQYATKVVTIGVQNALASSMKDKKEMETRLGNYLQELHTELEMNSHQYSKEEVDAMEQFEDKLLDSLHQIQDAIHQEVVAREAVFTSFGLLSAKEIKTLYQKAMDSSSSIEEKEQIADELAEQSEKLFNLVEKGEIAKNIGNPRIEFLNSKVKAIDNFIPTLPEFQEQIAIQKQPMMENGITVAKIKNFFANQQWFKKKEQEPTTEEKENKKAKLGRKAIGIGAVLTAGVLALGGMAYSNHKLKKENEALKIEAQKELEKKLENSKNVTLQSAKDELFNQKEEVITEKKVVANYFKEEQIMELVEALKERFNAHDGMNVTTEQALALFIHVNAANSYTNGNTLALDKITRENLVKKYYVGLTEGTEEFASYTITDADLSRLSSGVQEIRNAAVNRVAVLNDEGKYAESKEIIGIFQEFITDESLKDEASVLTSSIQNMQTSDFNSKKRELHRYYEYIFAGPKSGVRNFDDYGHYVDGDNKEMTFENQGTTIRFDTWLLDAFTGLHVKGIIPQDIINSKNVKLMDQSNLLRILGFKNCGASDFSANYALYFNEPIENGKKSSTKKSSSSSSSKSSTIAHALGNEQLDIEMDAQLQQNTDVGDTFKLGDGSTVTVVESGDKSKTVVVIPDPSSEEKEDTTPSGERERETTEGGGNEQEETIKFKPDENESVIDEGGSVIYDDSTDASYYEEEISFVEDETEIEFIPEETIVIEVIEENQEVEVQTEASTEVAYAITSEIQTLTYLRNILASDTLTSDSNENNFGYVKTFRI